MNARERFAFLVRNLRKEKDETLELRKAGIIVADRKEGADDKLSSEADDHLGDERGR